MLPLSIKITQFILFATTVIILALTLFTIKSSKYTIDNLYASKSFTVKFMLLKKFIIIKGLNKMTKASK